MFITSQVRVVCSLSCVSSAPPRQSCRLAVSLDRQPDEQMNQTLREALADIGRPVVVSDALRGRFRLVDTFISTVLYGLQYCLCRLESHNSTNLKPYNLIRGYKHLFSKP